MSPAAFSESLTRLRDALGTRARASQAPFIAASCPAPRGAARSLVDLEVERHSVYFSEGVGSRLAEVRGGLPLEFVGIGGFVSMRLEGNERFAEARRRMDDAFRQVDASPEDLSTLRFFGGASFQPGRDGQGNCWGDFGDATFFLPRVTYVDGPDEARLVCLSEANEHRTTLALAQKVLETAGLDSPPTSTGIRALSRKESEAPDSWDALVRSIQSCIDGGTADKIVAARRVTLELSATPFLSSIVDRMNAQAPRCARFAFRVGERKFVGATPERLVLRMDREVRTEALAGSIGVGVPGAAEKLLLSVKDQHEHAYVVEAIRTVLSPLCAELHVSREPEIRELKHVLHLRTPVRGTLTRDTHVLRLVELLHPTPAVGGLPRESALRFIEDHEKAERGWYAAPFGWVDSCGNGEFVVALRSGLLHRNKVHLYAGAGIVAGSNAGDEFVETELKLSGMLGALGVDD